MSPAPHRPEPEPEPRVVVRDKRRIDPDSGAVREAPDPEPRHQQGGAAAGPPAAAPGPGGAADPEADRRVAELTETLQRLKAEYDNYRRRAERERAAVAEFATGMTLSALLPVLDDLDRARTHGDLVGAFGSVGEALAAAVAKLGLESYAEAGEEFDPQVHEAVMTAAPAPGVEHPVVAQVFRPGYRHAGRVLRAAQVSVSEPADAGQQPAGEQPAGEQPAGEQPAGEQPAGEQPPDEQETEGTAPS